jgi:uncharacterized protein (DUF736 family)
LLEITLAIIGNFTASDDGFDGSIKTLTLDFKVRLARSHRRGE